MMFRLRGGFRNKNTAGETLRFSGCVFCYFAPGSGLVCAVGLCVGGGDRSGLFCRCGGCRGLGCFVILLSFILAGLWVWTEYGFLQEIGRIV